MGECATFFDCLAPYLFKLRVLANVSAGDVIVLDENGQWCLAKASALKSGLRSTWAFATRQNIQSQRTIFLQTAKETIKMMDASVRLLCKTESFAKCLNPKGILSQQKINEFPRDVREEVECMLDMFCSITTHIQDGLKGLDVLKTSLPYSSDKTFCSSIDVSIRDPSLHILEFLYRRVGTDFEAQVFPFINNKAGLNTNIIWQPKKTDKIEKNDVKDMKDNKTQSCMTSNSPSNNILKSILPRNSSATALTKSGMLETSTSSK